LQVSEVLPRIKQDLDELTKDLNDQVTWEENEHKNNALQTFTDYSKTGIGVSCNRVEAASEAVKDAQAQVEQEEEERLRRYNQRNDGIDAVGFLARAIMRVAYEGIMALPRE